MKQTYEDYLAIKNHVQPQWEADKKIYQPQTPDEWLFWYPEAQEIIEEKIFEWQAIADELTATIAKKKGLLELHLQETHTTDDPVVRQLNLLSTGILADGKKLHEAQQHVQRLAGYLNTYTPDDEDEVTPDDIAKAKTADYTYLIPDQIRQAGQYRKTNCPFHNERTPSFVIYPDNSFYCFGCQEAGDSISFVRKYQNLNFIEAVKTLLKHG